MGDVVAVGGFSVVFIAVLATADWLHRRWRVGDEAARKFAHVACGLVAAVLPEFMSFAAIAVLAALFIPFMLVSRRYGIFPAVHRAERSTLGELYFPVGVLVVAVLFPEPAAYTYGVLVMAVSDAAAGLLGKRFGHRTYRISGALKTYVGSFAFFASTLVITCAVLALGEPSASLFLLTAASISLLLSLVEGSLGGGIDNVVLPGAAAGLLTLMT
jgi:dolichol kinase